MLLANVVVAEHLLKTCRDKTILRAHDPIKDRKREAMINYFNKIGLEINMQSPITIRDSIEAIKEQPDSTDKLHVVNRKFLTNLTQA